MAEGIMSEKFLSNSSKKLSFVFIVMYSPSTSYAPSSLSTSTICFKGSLMKALQRIIDIVNVDFNVPQSIPLLHH